jgi:deoxyribodipyrimidine photo-lyase
MVSPLRVRVLVDRPENPAGDHVLYWMVANRRTTDNFALQHALDASRRLRRPLLVLEPLRAAYPYASARLHAFVVEGMADQRRAFAAAGVRYFPYVEPAPGAGRGLLEALAARACLVVTDRNPQFFLPRMVAAAAARLPVRTVDVDAVGLLPLAATTKAWPSAASFRRHFQRSFPTRYDLPEPEPLRRAEGPAAVIPPEILARWPAADALLDDPSGVRALVGGPAPVARRGGSAEAARRLERFVEARLHRYPERNHPDEDAASGLSPWLHFGHLSAHTVFRAVTAGTGWSPERLGAATGSREGYWGLDPAREGFLDELVTWRELGHTFSALVPDAESYPTLPTWARGTLDAHAADPRPERYDLATLEAGATRDPLWNAAQAQLRREGVMHNYLRMLWGKKVLEWSASPAEAFETLVTLNHRYALDGRDPNSTAGISWCFGRFDRPWFPERPIFGTIRYMSSDSTRKKLRLKGWLARYGAEGLPLGR